MVKNAKGKVVFALVPDNWWMEMRKCAKRIHLDAALPEGMCWFQMPGGRPMGKPLWGARLMKLEF